MERRIAAVGDNIPLLEDQEPVRPLSPEQIRQELTTLRAITPVLTYW